MDSIERSNEFFKSFWNEIAPNLHCDDLDFFERCLMQIRNFKFQNEKCIEKIREKNEIIQKFV